MICLTDNDNMLLIKCIILKQTDMFVIIKSYLQSTADTRTNSIEIKIQTSLINGAGLYLYSYDEHGNGVQASDQNARVNGSTTTARRILHALSPTTRQQRCVENVRSDTIQRLFYRRSQNGCPSCVIQNIFLCRSLYIVSSF